MNRILEIDEANLTAVIEPGVLLQDSSRPPSRPRPILSA